MIYGGTDPTVEPEKPELVTCDLDGSGTVNATDAAIILQYAAYIGAGNPEMSLVEFMQNKKQA